MREPLRAIQTLEEFGASACELRRLAIEEPLDLHRALSLFEQWANALTAIDLHEVPGITFLRLWLRRNTLESLLAREFGKDCLDGAWSNHGRARLRAFPVGVVGHWPAGNIEIQPVLSLTCALLGGNSSIVRVPSSSIVAVQQVLEKLLECDTDRCLTPRIALTSFEHDRAPMHEAMAREVDGAMIWGGAEAVTDVRALPFPSWTRLVVFGPRLSVAAMDREAWCDLSERAAWCRRIARDVWQFDQQACSSPQTLFLERCPEHDPAEFVEDLKRAFEAENRVHPRRQLHPSLTSAICLARASWQLASTAHRAWFPESPDWTILLGDGVTLPRPTQGRTLSVLIVDDLLQAVSGFDGAVQTLGLAMKSRKKEEWVADAAGYHGVDRVVRMGQMHTFGSPWDGSDLVRPMVRLVRHLPSQQEDEG